MSLKPMFILTKAELYIFFLEQFVVSKKVDKRHKNLNVSSQDFHNIIELLKQYNALLSNLLSLLLLFYRSFNTS